MNGACHFRAVAFNGPCESRQRSPSGTSTSHIEEAPQVGSPSGHSEQSRCLSNLHRTCSMGKKRICCLKRLSGCLWPSWLIHSLSPSHSISYKVLKLSSALHSHCHISSGYHHRLPGLFLQSPPKESSHHQFFAPGLHPSCCQGDLYKKQMWSCLKPSTAFQ